MTRRLSENVQIGFVGAQTKLWVNNPVPIMIIPAFVERR